MADGLPSDDILYAALLARDAAFDGVAYVGVTSTDIFCRLTCPARKPKRANTVFFATAEAAIASGFRPCRRCRPLAEPDAESPIVAQLVARLAAGERCSERDLAAAGLDPSTVRRAFRRRFGTTFIDLARRERVARGLDLITAGGRVIDAQLDAGFESASGFRAAVTRVVGRPPARLRQATPPAPANPVDPLRPPGQNRTMPQTDKALRFASLHVKGDPLILYNAWDAGSARVVAEAGAAAIATGSWSVAAAQGYPDGEVLPLDDLERIAGRIVGAVTQPVTVDAEGGYAVAPDALAENVRRLLAVGVVGINLEDRVVGAPEPRLHGLDAQCGRIRAIRAMAAAAGVPLFVNARTDLFLQADPAAHAGLVAAARERAVAYAAAGAGGFFVPGLVDERLIAEVCAAVTLPVNVMMRDGMASPGRLAALGVARISHGPAPYRTAMAALSARAAEAFRRDA